MRKASKKTLKAKADKLAGQACREKGYCEAHEWVQKFMFGIDNDPQSETHGHLVFKGHRCSNRYEWAHIKSRGICSIRHDPKNCVCLCNICHRYFTQNPDRFKHFIDWLDPDRWDYLNEQMCLHKKPDYEYWIDYYQSGVEG